MEKKDKIGSEEGYKIALIVLGIVIVIMLMDIIHKLDNISYNAGDEDVVFNSNSYYEELDTIISKLDKKDTIVESIGLKIAGVDGKENSIIYNVTIRLKEFSNKTKVSVEIGGNTAELKLKNNRFIGTMNVSAKLDLDDESAVVYSNDGNTIKTEKVSLYDEQEGEGLAEGVWDIFDADAEPQYVFDENHITFDITDIEYEIHSTEKSGKMPVLFIEKNGEVIYEKELDQAVDKVHYSYDKEVQDEDKFSVGIKYQGKSGCTYELYMLKHISELDDEGSDENKFTMYGTDGKKITTVSY